MAKLAKLTVSTGWAGGDHVDYWELPDDFDEMQEEEKEEILSEMANDYLHEVCSAYGEAVDEED